MLRSWILLLCCLLCNGIPAWTASSGSSISCPGFCIMTSEACNVVLENGSCGSDFRCCLDGIESSRLDPTERTSDHTNDPFEFTTVDVDDTSKYSELSSEVPVANRDQSKPANQFDFDRSLYSSPNPSRESEAKNMAKCPGACIPQLYSQYCEYLIPSELLCSSDSMCCISKKQAEDIGSIDPEYSEAELSPDYSEAEFEPESVQYTNFQESSRYETEQTYCPGTCISIFYAVLCDRLLIDYYCPSNSICCNKTTYGISSLKECTGHCIPSNLRPHCRPPLQLVPTATCRQGTICCEQPSDSSTQLRDSYYGQDLATEFQNSDNGILDRLAQDEMGNIYLIDSDGRASPMSSLTPKDHLYNHYSRVTEFDQEDGMKIIIFADKNNAFYFQRFADGSKRGIEDAFEQVDYQPLGMPDINVVGPEENITPPDEPISEDIGDIEASLKDFIIPEEGDVVPSFASTTQTPDYRQPRPSCPGSCLSYYLRFTCSGKVSIYDGFACEDSKICCASIKAIEEHEDYLKTLSPLPRTPTTMLERNFPSCGVKGHKELANVESRDSLPGEWCWQVAIISSSKQYLCAGVLIDKTWVLTAAHCVSGTIREGQTLTVAAGVLDLTDTSTHKEAQSRKVVSSVIHENHNRVSLDNDIALLKLESSLEQSSDICVVCLPASPEMPKEGTKCVVSGYGFPAEGGSMSLKTQAAVVSLVDDTDCMANITNALSIVYLIPSSSFCAGNGNGSSCQGDAGAPLVCERNGIYELFGVLSWTLECGREDVPSVYVNLPSIMSWIHRIVTST